MLNNIKKKIIAFKNNDLFKKAFMNSSWLMLQNIFSLVTGLFVTAVVARYLGATNYGIFNYALSITSLFSGIASFGMNHIAIKDLAIKPEDHSKIMGTVLILRLIFAVILFIACQLVLYWLCYQDQLTFIVGTILSGCMLFNIFNIITYYTQVTLNSKFEAISKILSMSILMILKLLVVYFSLNLKMYAFSYLIESIIYVLILFISYKKITKSKKFKPWYFDKSYAKKLLSSSWYFALSSIMVIIYLRIDQVMIGKMIADKSQLGIYSAAVRITDLWTFVPLALISSYRPIIIEKKKEGEIKYYNNLQRLYYIVSFICFIFLIFIIIFSKIIVIILYGSEFIDAVNPLKILIFGTWFGVLGNIHYIWMSCDNNQKYSLLYSVIGASSNIILNLFLIPIYGIMGAAVATLISQVLSNIVSFAFLKKTRILSKMILKSIFLPNYFINLKRRSLKNE
ncbi:MAG: flippase [Bacilli bacterium]|nr:flippase [Bacilli bacterium]